MFTYSHLPCRGNWWQGCNMPSAAKGPVLVTWQPCSHPISGKKHQGILDVCEHRPLRHPFRAVLDCLGPITNILPIFGRAYLSVRAPSTRYGTVGNGE